MNATLIIVAVACVGLGYYAWQRQQRALVGLETLKNSGVQVSFWIRSRPLLAVDNDKGKLYLIDGRQPQKPTRLDVLAVTKVTFVESPPVSNENTDPRGPDTLLIETSDGHSHRVGDLPGGDSGAKNAMSQFKKHGVLTDKLVYQSR